MSSNLWKKYAKKCQRQNIANAMGQESLCDVTFLIGCNQIEFRANRFVLATVSEVFKAMLYGSMKEGQPESIITIPDIDEKGFQGVLDFAYCKDPRVTVENVVSIANVAQKYQITSLSPICTDYFKTFVDIDSFCSLLNNAVNLHLEHLIGCCLESMQFKMGRYTKEIIESPAFLQMDLPAMKVFLQMDELEIKEEVLWEAVLKWNANRGEAAAMEPPSKRRKLNDVANDNLRNKELRELSQLIRFGLMDGRYFSKEVTPMNVLTDKEALTVMRYYHYPEGGCGGFVTKKRSIVKIANIPFKLDMSSKWDKCANTVESLGDIDLKLGCGTNGGFPASIVVEFEQTALQKIEIAAIDTPNDWGPNYLNGTSIVAGGKVIATISDIKRGEIKTILFEDNVIASKLEFRNRKTLYLGIGYLIVYGRVNE